MNAVDYLILFGALIGVAVFAVWRTRGKRDFNTYLKGSRETRWLTIGLSVMATQASAITFLSTPGQGYESGLGFVQNYFGAPFALIIISAVFLPIYRRLKVYTAYEFLGHRFDAKTRLLGAAMFLLQRGLGAGLTIYAPAIVLSTVMGWSLDATIICSGLLVIIYTATGGCEAVNLTQKYQIGIIFAGMFAAFFVLLARMPAGLGLSDALTLAGRFHRLGAVDYSLSVDRRYTFWSGLLGGMFLALAYFGTDQSQVQRYLSGGSLRESRLGLMFNAVLKIPMQVFILLMGALIFVFYQFERPPVYFNQAAWTAETASGSAGKLRQLDSDFGRAHADESRELRAWLEARRDGDRAAEAATREAALAAEGRKEQARAKTKLIMSHEGTRATANDADYVFIRFILDYLPHGLIGLLVTAFFAAALSSKAGELNALGSTTTVDFYRHLVGPGMTDAHYVAASRWFTAFWGLVAIAFALFAHLAENLIQATNILGSVFYGAPLGLFLVAFFFKRVGGTAVFWAALAAQAIVFALCFTRISYLWYNVVGCAACIAISLVLQAGLDASGRAGPEPAPA
ncbi:MAG TPA: sodium:solute symporter [Opitutaceae bacterium]